jgi:preprotein translocase subunit SecE
VADKSSRSGDAVDEVEDDLEVADVDDQPSPGRVASRRRAPAARPSRREVGGPGLLGRLVRFVREIVAELAKVIWPTRRELTTYTLVVVVFVSIVVSVVAGLDYGFARLMVFVFGSTV